MSEAGQCPRKQTLRALGYDADAPDQRALSIFRSGDEHEDALYALWASRYPRKVRRQILVRSPFGTGHMDIWVAPLRHIVESKTTTEKSLPYLPMKSHVAQVQMYLHYWGNAHGATAEIAYRIKETGQILSYPVVYDPALAQELVQGLQIVQAAIRGKTPIPVPDEYQAFRFPCAWGKPGGNMGHCPYWEHCWGGSSTETVRKAVVAVAPQLEREALEYAEVRQKRQAIQAQVEVLQSQEGAMETMFRRVLDAASATKLRAGRVALSRSCISGRVFTDIAAAIKDGVVTAKEIAPYQKQGDGFDRWTVKVTKGEDA